MSEAEDGAIVYIPFHPDRVIIRACEPDKTNKDEDADSQNEPDQRQLFIVLNQLVLELRGIMMASNMDVIEYVIRTHWSTHELRRKKISLSHFKRMAELTVELVQRSIVTPGEMVGLLAAESTGEPTTQMSFTGDTAVLLNEGGNSHHVRLLGPWIEKKIALATTLHLHNVDLTTVVDLTCNDIKVPSCDAQGIIQWRPVTHATRHPPNGELIKVTTRRGRMIKATLAKSFLVMRGGTIEPIAGSDLRIGDVLPLTAHLPHEVKQEHIDLRQWLLPTEWWYGSEMAILLSGSDTPAITPTKQTRDNIYPSRKQPLPTPYVFPRSLGNRKQRIPEQMLLDADFGFFVGAYLAEGHSEKYVITITNEDPAFRSRVEGFAIRFGLTYNVNTSQHELQTTIDINLSSMVLATLMCEICGSDSLTKAVPDFTYTAPLPFITNLLDGYFSGQVHHNKGRDVLADSISQALLSGIGTLLNIFGIAYHLDSRGKTSTGNPVYMLSVQGQDAALFGTHIPLTHTTKKLQIATMLRNTLQCVSEHYRLGDVCNDEIVSLERFVSLEPWVYDLTIPETLNFGLANGIHVRDTLNTSVTFTGVLSS